MFFVIGVDHIIQHGAYLDDQKKVAIEAFLRHLNKAVRKYNIILIAEEFSEVALSKSNTDYCTCREAANKLNIEHRFCDPTPKERKALSIETNDEREMEWLRRVGDVKTRHILFICGSSHLESFLSLLRKHSIESVVLSDKWGFDYLGKGQVQYFEVPCDIPHEA